jgi:hypothetical protein
MARAATGPAAVMTALAGCANPVAVSAEHDALGDLSLDLGPEIAEAYEGADVAALLLSAAHMAELEDNRVRDSAVGTCARGQLLDHASTVGSPHTHPPGAVNGPFPLSVLSIVLPLN